ncbi:RNA-directed DNA polymerase from mobile element jockey [Trichonephila clavipes]|nr:RNA-directed DNA polymerase from mobile element jockey [Trichonephila clavipes]
MQFWAKVKPKQSSPTVPKIGGEVSLRETSTPTTFPRIKETSTQHQLLRVTNKINGFNTKSYTVGIFLDVKKAFDRMWHDGLIYKMIKLKFPTYLVKITHNYLDNRTFNVKINSISSSIRNIVAGTPQGSILSPALYNIFTSDFPTTPSVSVCLFADDAAILCNSITADQAVRTSQSYLSQLETWLIKWRIAINTDKTNAIIFRKRRANTMPPQLKLFDESINWTFQTSYLGLILNDNLTYQPHFNEIKQKYWTKHFSLIELLGRKSKLSLKNRIFIYKTYLRPMLTYGCAIWGAAANNHLEDMQTPE